MKNLKLILALFLFSQFIYAQDRKVTGVVKDSVGQILLGVSIGVEGTYRGTQTDINGRYSINANSNEFLEFSYLGKKSQKIKAEKNEINVILKESDIKMEETLPYEIYKQIKPELETTTLKIAKGYVFVYDNSVNSDLPLIGATIQIKGTERKTKTNSEGYYEIFVKEKDTLIVSSITSNSIKEIYITNTNCYNVSFNTNYTDGQDFHISKKNKKRLQKSARKVKKRNKNGYYECKD